MATREQTYQTALEQIERGEWEGGGWYPGLPKWVWSYALPRPE